MNINLAIDVKYLFLFFAVLFLSCRNQKYPLLVHREDYRLCTNQKIDSIISENEGTWMIDKIDSTSNYYVLFLSRKEKGTEIIAVSSKAQCFSEKVKVGQLISFLFSCDISSQGNHSFYIHLPNQMFIGHNINYRVPIGEKTDFVHIPTNKKVFVLKATNLNGLCLK